MTKTTVNDNGTVKYNDITDDSEVMIMIVINVMILITSTMLIKFT